MNKMLIMLYSYHIDQSGSKKLRFIQTLGFYKKLVLSSLSKIGQVEDIIDLKYSCLSNTDVYWLENVFKFESVL